MLDQTLYVQTTCHTLQKDFPPSSVYLLHPSMARLFFFKKLSNSKIASDPLALHIRLAYCSRQMVLTRLPDLSKIIQKCSVHWFGYLLPTFLRRHTCSFHAVSTLVSLHTSSTLHLHSIKFAFCFSV